MLEEVVSRNNCHSQNGGPASGISVWGERKLMVPNLESRAHGAIVQIHIFPLLRLPLVLCEQEYCPRATKLKHAAFLGA